MDTMVAGRIDDVIDFLSAHPAEPGPATEVHVLPYEFGSLEYGADELERDWWAKQLGSAA